MPEVDHMVRLAEVFAACDNKDGSNDAELGGIVAAMKCAPVTSLKGAALKVRLVAGSLSDEAVLTDEAYIELGRALHQALVFLEAEAGLKPTDYRGDWFYRHDREAMGGCHV